MLYQFFFFTFIAELKLFFEAYSSGFLASNLSIFSQMTRVPVSSVAILLKILVSSFEGVEIIGCHLFTFAIWSRSQVIFKRWVVLLSFVTKLNFLQKAVEAVFNPNQIFLNFLFHLVVFEPYFIAFFKPFSSIPVPLSAI